MYVERRAEKANSARRQTADHKTSDAPERKLNAHRRGMIHELDCSNDREGKTKTPQYAHRLIDSIAIGR
jgi:hypothetical protein